jgi:iron only hydrogenase large subunit-like protein
MKKGVEELNFPLKEKYVVMLAPSFVIDFQYPKIISQLRDLGFEKVVELTFGAKMINRDYHKRLKNSKGLIISSVCPGIVETINAKYPSYKNSLIQIDSPMIATAKICRKIYPSYKIFFISPCNFKKTEAQKSKYVDYVIDYKELKVLLDFHGLTKKKYQKKDLFDRFYNDYTKIYPLSGGLSKTAHIKNILQLEETKTIDGFENVGKFLSNPDKNIKFLDVTFCNGGCIGGPCISSKLPLLLKKKKVMSYINVADKEIIPEERKGLIKEAKGISFKSEYLMNK